MKKFYLVLLTFLLVLSVTACELPFGKKDTTKKQQATTTEKQEVAKPTFSGLTDKEVKVGEKFKPLDGVTAKDYDGTDLTDDIEYSGNVDLNTPGTYQATYSVTGKGGETSVTIKVTVVAVDEEGPLLTGCDNITVIVSKPFDKMSGVSANDTFDGDLTAKIVAKGEVDYTHTGDYTVEYTVSDNSGNETKKTRKVTVATGAFTFDDNKVTAENKVTASIDEKQEYGLIKVYYTVDAKATVKITFLDQTVTTERSEAGTYFDYVGFSENIENAEITVENATFASYVLGDAADAVAPTITGDFDQTFYISKTNLADAAKFVVEMSGAVGKDDRDGYITDNITADTSKLDLNSKEPQKLALTLTDAAGNTCDPVEVNVIVAEETLIADLTPSMENEYILSYRNFTIGEEEGVFGATAMESGGYCSHNMIKYDLSKCTYGNYYVLKVVAKVNIDKEKSPTQTTQNIGYRIGQSLAADPWYNEFSGFTYSYFAITEEYATYYHIFKYDVEKTEESAGEAMEFQLGNTTWNSIYDVYVKEFGLYLLSNEDQAPQLIVDSSLKTVVVSGEEVNLDAYVSAIDVEDGALNVTHTGTIGTEAGYYDIEFSAKDSYNNVSKITIKFEVLTEEDTTSPVITFSGDNPMELAIDSISTEDAIAQFSSMITIKDTKNGAEYDIALEDATVDFGNFDTSAAGKYTIKVSAKDSSGNSTELAIVVKVVKESSGDGEYELLSDYLTQTFTQEKVTAELNDGVLEIVPTTFEGGGWASYNKSKFELLANFEVGKKYKLVVEAKADVARTIKANFTACESSYSKYGSIGFVQCDLSTEYEKFEVEFVYTGKFTKDSVEYNIAYASLEFQIGNINWDSGETTSNKVYVKTLALYEEYEGESVGNYMEKSFTQENVTTVKNENGVLEIIPTTFEGGGWASFNKSKFEMIQAFEVGHKYKLVVIAKADEARKIRFVFSAAEANWSKYGNVCALECDVTGDYQRFEIEFTYTGKFTKDEVEYDIIYTALELQVGNIDWSSGESLTNKVYVKKIDLYEIIEPELVGDYLTQAFTQENLTATLNEGVLELVPTTFEGGGWASYNKSKFELIESFEVGKTYKLVVEAKADEARKIKVTFSAADSNWSKYGSVGYVECDLSTEYEKFEVEFTYTGQFEKDSTLYDIGYVALEVQLGNIDWSSGESITNKVYIKTIDLYEIPSED